MRNWTLIIVQFVFCHLQNEQKQSQFKTPLLSGYQSKNTGKINSKVDSFKLNLKIHFGEID